MRGFERVALEALCVATNRIAPIGNEMEIIQGPYCSENASAESSWIAVNQKLNSPVVQLMSSLQKPNRMNGIQSHFQAPKFERIHDMRAYTVSKGRTIASSNIAY